MTKPTLIIDPGHGGKDPGGGSSIFWDPAGFYEKDIVLDISLYQAERFRALGVETTLTRTTDEYIDSSPRAKAVRDSGARYCISNHINAASNASARGVETIHSILSDGKLATALCNAIAAEGMPKRRVFTRALPSNPQKDYYFMHRDTGSVSTVIVEYGFATNAADAAQLQANWKAYAEAVVRAFCMHIDHPYTPPASAPATPVTVLPPTEATCDLEVNGRKVDAGYIINGRAYVPARALADSLGAAAVDWDGVTRTVKVTK